MWTLSWISWTQEHAVYQIISSFLYDNDDNDKDDDTDDDNNK